MHDWQKRRKMKKTNFDQYLEEQLRDQEFAARFEQAGQAWDVALQIAALRQQAGLSQKELAKLLKTSQQQISRLESPLRRPFAQYAAPGCRGPACSGAYRIRSSQKERNRSACRRGSRPV